jgi:uncharacterized protein YlzI (FlbEa/FlbD family)
MKKLIINVLLVVGVVAIFVGLFMALSTMRAVDDTAAVVEGYNYEEAYAAEQAIQKESAVTVTISDGQDEVVEEAIEEVEEDSNDVDAFLNSLGDVEG